MFFRNFSLTIACFLLLACTPADWQVVRGATESGPPEDIVIDTTVQRVYNCGSGGGTIHLTTQRSLSIGESVHWEIGVELEGGIGLPELGAELQAVYGAGYETSAETGLGWQLSAQPGEWIEYTI
nr:hypothetical protein [Caldilineaceae bacterium]